MSAASLIMDKSVGHQQSVPSGDHLRWLDDDQFGKGVSPLKSHHIVFMDNKFTTYGYGGVDAQAGRGGETGFTAQTRWPTGGVRSGQDRACHRGGGCGDRRVRGRNCTGAGRGRSSATGSSHDGGGGAGAGRRRTRPDGSRLLRYRPGLHRLPRTPCALASRSQGGGRRRRLDERIPVPRRLAGARQRQPGLLTRWADPQRVRQGHCQLLAGRGLQS